jgi:rare lipoprotein A
MRPRRSSCAVLMAGAFSISVAAPAAAQTATIASAGVAKKRLHVRAGQRAKVIGAASPAAPGHTASLQIRRNGRWRTIDRDRTTASGRYVLRARIRRTMTAPARVRVGELSRRLGRLNVYRFASASWYGPGLYGNRTGCGGTLDDGRLGVAHKSLPCGTMVTFKHGRREVRVPVIDRGPYVGGREYDLTEATARKLRFRGHGAILTTE